MQVLMMPDYRHDNPYQTLLAESLEQNGVKVVFPRGYRRVFPIFRAIQSEETPTDVLHLHWTDPYLKGDNWLVKAVYSIKFLLDILLTRWSGKRIVWTVHNTLSHDAKFPRLELFTQQMLSKFVNGIIVHNYSVVDDISRLNRFPPYKASVIPIGHYRSLYHPRIDQQEARHQLGLPMTGRIFLNFGMIKPYKGIEHLLEIWAEHKSVLHEHTLMIVGKAFDETYGNALKAKACGIPGVTFLHEFILDEQVHLYLSAADVVVLPFTQILTSSSLILGMSYGKPVIAPRLGGVVETVGKADWFLYDPTDPDGLIHAIKDSLDSDLESFTQQVDVVCDGLDWETIGHKTKNIYHSMSSHAA